MIITAKIIKIEKHPTSTKLKICSVTDGKKTFQIVCGADNAKENMISILAKENSKLPNGTEIKHTKIKDIDSYGMLCSAKDLNISEEAGIIDLPSQTELGIDYKKIDIDLMSSFPWHQYKETESFWQTENGTVAIIRGPTKNETGMKLLSKTYWTGSEYIYRHFSR